MIFNIKKHNSDLYNTLLTLSRNIFFYENIMLKDCFENRIYLMFFHFSLMMIIFKKKGIKFDQNDYDSLFFCIENNLRELGFGDIAVNKKMKELNKILYDILLKIEIKNSKKLKFNEEIIFKYFSDLNRSKSTKFNDFKNYFNDFYNFCFELPPDNMVRDTINFRN